MPVVTVGWMVDLRAEQRGDPAGAATPNASGDGDELCATGQEGDGEPLRGGTEPGLPEQVPGRHIQRAEVPVDIARKDQPPGRGQRRGQ